MVDSPIYKYGINLNKLTTYMSSSIPIILASSSPNNPVLESQCGFSCKAENSKELAALMKCMISIPVSKRIQLGQNGYNYAHSHLSVDALALKMETCLRKVVDN